MFTTANDTYSVNILKPEENFFVSLSYQAELFIPLVLLCFAKILQMCFVIGLERPHARSLTVSGSGGP